MTKENSTEIIFVVDRSGSMKSTEREMCVGFDNFISKQKEINGDCRVTLVKFDDQYEVAYEARPLSEIGPLTLQPRGGTALLDAIGRCVNETGQRFSRMQESDRPSQVLFVIITDGQENFSCKFKHSQVFDMLTHQREKYNWEFVFLGANQDAIATGQELGIHSSNSVTYKASAAGSRVLFNSLTAGVLRYRSDGRGTMENLCDQKTYDELMDEDIKTKSSTINTTKLLK